MFLSYRDENQIKPDSQDQVAMTNKDRSLLPPFLTVDPCCHLVGIIQLGSPVH